MGFPNSRLAIAGVLALAAVLRCLPLGLASQRFFHEDEWDFAESVLKMWDEGTLDPGRPYVHPGLYRYSMAAVYPLASALLPARVDHRWSPYVAGRLVSAAMGVLAVWLVYRLGQRLMPWPGGLAAGLLLAAAPLHVEFSHVAKPDVAMAGFVALATLLAWRLAEAPRRGLYVLGGIAVGLAVASKYSGIVAAAPIVAAHLVAPGGGRGARRLLARDLWLAAACSMLAFAATSPYTLANLHALGEGYGLLIGRPPDPEHAPRAPALAIFAWQAAGSLGPLTLALAAAGAAIWWRERRSALLIVGSVVIATLAVLSAWAVQRPFYLLPLVPAVATMAAAPVAWVAARRRWAGALLLAACLAPSAFASVRQAVKACRPTTQQLAMAWLLENVPRPEGVILRDYDSLELSAEEKLPIIDAGLAFYYKVDREYLKRNSVAYFVLSDTAAATGHLRPEAARRRDEARQRLLDSGQLLARIPQTWWREGTGIEVHKVKDSLLAQFAREREQEAAALRAKLKEAEERLAADPADAEPHMAAGRILCDLAAVSRSHDAVALWQRAEGHFRAASAAAGRPADALYNLGCLYLRVAAWATSAEGPEKAAAVFARAAQAFRDAIALDPSQADYHFNLGFALWFAGTPDDAAHRDAIEEGARAYRRAAELDPGIRVPDPHILAVAERGPQPMR